ncbi:MAG: otsB [Actinotalea sp.]|nr:otsB [Actinotalea sp.]
MRDEHSYRTSTAAQIAIAQAAGNPRGTALFLDFDGTLAPFVGATEDVALDGSLLDVLADLTDRLAAVGVVSGRPVEFLRRVLPVPGLRLAGVYGLEEWVDGEVRDAPGVAEWFQDLAAARDELLAATLDREDVTVKDKRVSVVVHWRDGYGRHSDDQRISRLVANIASSSGLRLQVGKSAEELLPPVATHKGAVVSSACRQVGATHLIYVGDDVGDLPAFGAVREIGGLAVVVDGVGQHGAPPEVLAAADVVLPEQRAVGAWLTSLATHLASGDRARQHALPRQWSGVTDLDQP